MGRILHALGVHVVCAAALAGTALCAHAQDHAREARLAEELLAAPVFGEVQRLAQASGHRFVALYLRAAVERGTVVLVHGRGWSPDYDLYGELRLLLADAGYSTFSIQMPVLPGTAKIGDYLPTFDDADERIALAIDWLRARGATKVAIVSHSLGATMANHYLTHSPRAPIDAWVFVSIINGLEDMFRIKVPVLDVFGTRDWDVARFGADERRAQLVSNPASRQVVIAGGQHFFEGQREELARVIAGFLDGAFGGAPAASTDRR